VLSIASEHERDKYPKYSYRHHTADTTPDMAHQNPSATSPKYHPFTLLSTSYKSVHDHAVEVHVLLPKNIASPQPRPVVVRFHGGFLVAGDALFDEWFPNWLISYLLQHDAIVVLPNYRLLPEATGLEIMQDMKDFWTWVRDGSLQRYLDQETTGVRADLDRILAVGESAGGYLSIQAALDGYPRATIATYPVLDVSSRFYTEEYEKILVGAPTVPKHVLANHLKEIEEDAKNGKTRVVTAATPPDRLPLAISLVQQGVYKKFLGDDPSLDPVARLDTVRADIVTPILIIHGKDDTAVPIEGSEVWLEKAESQLGPGNVELIVQPGDHGFDGAPDITLETPWLRDGLVRITKAWLE
jgi:acetyl esterase/lipase